VSDTALLEQIAQELAALRQQSIESQARLELEVAALRQQLADANSTEWLPEKELNARLKKRARWGETWRKAGLFTIEGGEIRNVGTERMPRYEYHLRRCEEQWAWWGTLTDEAKRRYRESAA
jgi:hypothetical protein